MDEFLYIVFNKPYGVLSQFTGEPNDKTLSLFNFPKGVYAAGRLDKDSEGLLFLTNDGHFNQKLTNPTSNKTKTYLVQVENIPTPEALKKLEEGVIIEGKLTKKAKATLLPDFTTEERDPPIRKRKSIPTAWIKLEITEGMNRQVRKMTASVGHPTLRLIRIAIGKYQMVHLGPGEWKYIKKSDIL